MPVQEFFCCDGIHLIKSSCLLILSRNCPAVRVFVFVYFGVWSGCSLFCSLNSFVLRKPLKAELGLMNEKEICCIIYVLACAVMPSNLKIAFRFSFIFCLLCHFILFIFRSLSLPHIYFNCFSHFLRKRKTKMNDHTRVFFSCKTKTKMQEMCVILDILKL